MAGNELFKARKYAEAAEVYSTGMHSLYPSSLIANVAIPSVVRCEKQLGLLPDDVIALLYTANDAADSATDHVPPVNDAQLVPSTNNFPLLDPSSAISSSATTSAAALELLEEFNKCCGNACMSHYKHASSLGGSLPTRPAIDDGITALRALLANHPPGNRQNMTAILASIDRQRSMLGSPTTTSSSSLIEEILFVAASSTMFINSDVKSSPLTLLQREFITLAAHVVLEIVGAAFVVDGPSSSCSLSTCVTARMECLEVAATGVLENAFLAKGHAFLGASLAELLGITTSIASLCLIATSCVNNNSSNMDVSPSENSVVTTVCRISSAIVEPVVNRVLEGLLQLPPLEVAAADKNPLWWKWFLAGPSLRALGRASQHLHVAMALLPELVPAPSTSTTSPSTTLLDKDSGGNDASVVVRAILEDAISSSSAATRQLIPDGWIDGVTDENGSAQMGLRSPTIAPPPTSFPFAGHVARGLYIVKVAQKICDMVAASSSDFLVPSPALQQPSEGVFTVSGLTSSSLRSISGNGVFFNPTPSSSTNKDRPSNSQPPPPLLLPAGTVVAKLTNPDSVAPYFDADVVLSLDKVTSPQDELVAASLCQCCGLSLCDTVLQKNCHRVGHLSTTIHGCTACRMVAFCSAACAARYQRASLFENGGVGTVVATVDRHALFECARYRKLREMFRQVTEGNDRFAQGAGGRQVDLPDNFLDIAGHTISTLSLIEAEAEAATVLQSNHRHNNSSNKVMSEEEAGDDSRRSKHRLTKRQLLDQLEGHDAEAAQATLPMVPILCQLLGANNNNNHTSNRSDCESPAAGVVITESLVAHIVGTILCNSMEVLNEEDDDDDGKLNVSDNESARGLPSRSDHTDDDNDGDSPLMAQTPYLMPLPLLTASMASTPGNYGGKGLACGQVLFLNALSHFNHSCRPNCATTTTRVPVEPEEGAASCQVSRPRTKAIKCVQTLRPIFPGEELSIAYIPSLYAQPKRRCELLSERFYFTCRCPACSVDGASTSKSNGEAAAVDTSRGGLVHSGIFTSAVRRLQQSQPSLAEVSGGGGCGVSIAGVALSKLLVNHPRHGLKSIESAATAVDTAPSQHQRPNLLLGTLLRRVSEEHHGVDGDAIHLLQDVLRGVMTTSPLPALPTTSQTRRLKGAKEVAKAETVGVSFIAAGWAAAVFSPSTEPPLTSAQNILRLTQKHFASFDVYQCVSVAERPTTSTTMRRPPGERTLLYFNRSQVMCAGIREKSVHELLTENLYHSSSGVSPQTTVATKGVVPDGMASVLLEIRSFRAELDRHLQPYNYAIQDVRNTATFALSVLSSHVLSRACALLESETERLRVMADRGPLTGNGDTSSELEGLASIFASTRASEAFALAGAACAVTAAATSSTLQEALLWGILTPDTRFPVLIDKKNNCLRARDEINALLQGVLSLATALVVASAARAGVTTVTAATAVASSLKQTLTSSSMETTPSSVDALTANAILAAAVRAIDGVTGADSGICGRVLSWM